MMMDATHLLDERTLTKERLFGWHHAFAGPQGLIFILLDDFQQITVGNWRDGLWSNARCIWWYGKREDSF